MDTHVQSEREDAAVAEAIRRSLVEKTREDALLADVLRASVLSHDAEVARALQAQLNLEDRAPGAPITRQMKAAGRLRESLQANDPDGPWLVARKGGRFEPVKPPPSASAPQDVPRVHVPPLRAAPQQAVRPQAASPHATSPVTPASAAVSSPRPRAPRVVLDGLNVGCALIGGGGRRFRARGVQLALEYYRARGVGAIALLPANKVDGSAREALADDVPLLMRLHEQQRLFFTPRGSHDDNFLLAYAMRHDADLVSNDRFRDELSRQRGTEAARRMRHFLRQHLVPFTFVLEEYMPNPNPESLSAYLHNPRDRGYH